MKRLNRKGFTLVELLAVIVILAIVVGITLVTVLPTLKKSRQEAFNLTAQTAADYVEKQYQLSLVGSNISGDTLEIEEFGSSTNPHDITTTEFEKAGLKAKNYDCSNGHVCTWYIDESTGRACVKLTRSTTGEYNDADLNDGVAQSTGCTTNTSSGNNSQDASSENNSQSGTN